MAWQTIVEASNIGELEYAPCSVQELEKDTEAIIRIDLPWWAPIGWLANLAGAEWWASQLVGSGMEVIDVYGERDWVEVKGKADPIWLIALIPLIVKALAALGISFAAVKVSANIFAKPAEEVTERQKAAEEYTYTLIERYGYTPEQASKALKDVQKAGGEAPKPFDLAGILPVALLALAAIVVLPSILPGRR